LRTQLLIANECPVTLQGLRSSLASVDNTEIVGEAMSAEETLRVATELDPDVVLLEPNLGLEESAPLQNGKSLELTLLQELKSLLGTPCVICYTAFNSVADLMAVMLAGADGYMHKSIPSEQLAQHMEGALVGKPLWWLGLRPEEAQWRLMVASRVERLSNTEKKVLGIVLKNSMEDEQIAQSLCISPHTLKKHITSILMKLEYRSRKAIFQD